MISISWSRGRMATGAIRYVAGKRAVEILTAFAGVVDLRSAFSEASEEATWRHLRNPPNS